MIEWILSLVRRKQLTTISRALSARNLGTTEMNVPSSRKAGSLRDYTRVRRFSWVPGVTRNQKKKILMKRKPRSHGWLGPMKGQKEIAYQKLTLTLMKKMRYTVLSHILNLKHA